MELRQLLGDLFEHAPLPAYVVDSNLTIILSNRLHRELSKSYDLGIESPVGLHLLKAAPFLDPGIVNTYQDIFRTGQMSSQEATYLIKGKETSIDVTRYPVFSGDKVSHVCVFFRDITELTKIRTDLKESEQIARALMNSSSESMFLIGEDERLIAANAAGAERLGLAPHELEGKSIYEVTPSEVAEARLAHYRRVRDTGEPLRFTDERQGRTYDITMFPVQVKPGAARRVAIYSRDVTEKEVMISALQSSERRFREFFDRTPVPTYVWRWDGKTMVLRDANRAAELLTEGKVTGWFGSTVEQMYSAKYPNVVADIRNCYLQRSHIVRELQYKLVSIDKEGFFEIHYVFVAPDEVMIHTVDLTARREAELELQRSHDELEQRVNARTSELAELNDQLRLEREALNQKNAAMRELISHINDNQSEMAKNIQANLQHVVAPILDRLQSRLDDNNGTYVRMLRESLEDLLSPHLAGLHVHHPHLTAHEIELCNLIRSGLTCKEIAELRGRSEQTILKQRKVIRKKLGLVDNRINLRNYLASGKIGA